MGLNDLSGKQKAENAKGIMRQSVMVELALANCE
jgi:hypothetical protein